MNWLSEKIKENGAIVYDINNRTCGSIIKSLTTKNDNQKYLRAFSFWGFINYHKLRKFTNGQVVSGFIIVKHFYVKFTSL